MTEKIVGCKIIPENSSATKIGEHISPGFSMSTKFSFRSIKNKHDACRGKNFMKKFQDSLREHSVKIINFKKMKILTNEQQKSYENAKIC